MAKKLGWLTKWLDGTSLLVHPYRDLKEFTLRVKGYIKEKQKQILSKQAFNLVTYLKLAKQDGTLL